MVGMDRNDLLIAPATGSVNMASFTTHSARGCSRTHYTLRIKVASTDVAWHFRREVLAYTPDAWIKEDATKIGYEISFTRHFYKPPPMRGCLKRSVPTSSL